MDMKYPAILHLQAGGRVPIATLCMRMIIMVFVHCGARGIAKVLSTNLSILLGCAVGRAHV